MRHADSQRVTHPFADRALRSSDIPSSTPFRRVLNMSRAPILFRCDATGSQGYESFYQCLAYAAALQRRRRGTYFLSRLSPATLLAAIQKGGNEWRPADFPFG